MQDRIRNQILMLQTNDNYVSVVHPERHTTKIKQQYEKNWIWYNNFVPRRHLLFNNNSACPYQTATLWHLDRFHFRYD